MTNEEVSNLTIDEIRDIPWTTISAMTAWQREILGRNIYDAVCTIPHDFTTGIFDKWDASATGKTHSYNLEIKFRWLTPDKKSRYDNEGYWLERTKYKALMEEYKKTGSIPCYITYIKGGTGYLWNLLDLKPKWEWREATTKSSGGEYGKEKKPKLVCYPLPKEGREFSW